MEDFVLRKAQRGDQKAWTKHQILSGLQHFYKLNDRYPTAIEIDSFEFLPSSRSIQRQFGGLVVLRKELIPDSHSNYTQGAYRSSVAKVTWHRAAKYEEEFYNFLCAHFDPVAIHEHKVMRPGNISSDFYIYINERQGVIIDLFYAKDMHSLRGVINIKKKRYESLTQKTIFLLVGNEELGIQAVRLSIKQRSIPLPPHILVDTETNFKSSTIYQIKELSKYARQW